MKIDFHREVDCPQALAFEYYADRDKDAEWWGGTVSTTRISEVARGVGERNRQVQKYYGLPFTATIEVEVVEWEPPHRWREICNSGFVYYDVWYVVDKLDERRSRVSLVGEAQLKGIMKLLYPLAKGLLERQTNQNYDLLKQKLDALGAAAVATRKAA
ncbi:MAG TPA: SRPBCC family protein [Nevskiaceae bacterium]|nr:SRPBCC family protein [Nevskiaceae bacterium]